MLLRPLLTNSGPVFVCSYLVHTHTDTHQTRRKNAVAHPSNLVILTPDHCMAYLDMAIFLFHFILFCIGLEPEINCM